MAILSQPPEAGEQARYLERLSVVLPSLRPSEARIAQRMIDDPGLAVAMTISEFAQACGVSQPTVSRFARRLGFPGYAALRLGIASDHASTKGAAPDGTRVRPSGLPDLGVEVAKLRADPGAALAAEALRHASHVEVWPDLEMFHAGAALADRLSAMDVPAACVLSPAGRSMRSRALPPGAMIVVVKMGVEPPGGALLRARTAGARVLYCTASADPTVLEAADWLLPLPCLGSADIVGIVLVEAIAALVFERSRQVEASPLASPWRPWPHRRPVHLPTGGGPPIPGVLLCHEDPPRKRPLVVFFTGLGHPKEEALPGSGATESTLVAPLLSAGYHVLAVDAPAHGERKRSWEDTLSLLQANFAGRGTNLLALAHQQAPDLVDGALSLGVTDASHGVGVAGMSWGGTHAILTLAGDPRVKAAAALLPVCHVARLPPFASFEDHARLRAAEPNERLAPKIAARALLVVAGDQDEQADPRDARAFVESLRASYGEREDLLRYVALAGTGHQWHPRLVTETLEWFSRVLPAPPPRTT